VFEASGVGPFWNARNNGPPHQHVQNQPLDMEALMLGGGKTVSVSICVISIQKIKRSDRAVRRGGGGGGRNTNQL